MKVAVIASEKALAEIKSIGEHVHWIPLASPDDLSQHPDMDALINLEENAAEQDYSKVTLPVFINSVCYTLKEKKHPNHVVRFNGWNGFVQRNSWELSGRLTEGHVAVMNLLNRPYVLVPDEPGFISARIIAMIINEAFFAKGEQVSTEDEIDIAMKLGTNYPKGPFEWMREIGIREVCCLLEILAQTDVRYKVSPQLLKEATAV